MAWSAMAMVLSNGVGQTCGDPGYVVRGGGADVGDPDEEVGGEQGGGDEEEVVVVDEEEGGVR